MIDLIGWLHTGSLSIHRLDREIRRVIPSCIVGAVHHKFPKNEVTLSLSCQELQFDTINMSQQKVAFYIIIITMHLYFKTITYLYTCA